MMKIIYFFFAVFFLASCGDKNTSTSLNENAAYFYPYDSIPRIYCYRDQVNGLSEKFHRVYGVEDSKGKHIVVEYYSEDGRIMEGYNFLVDSLRLVEHMVVNRRGQKVVAELLKNALYPFTKSEKTWFASRFEGFQDSTLILAETLRGFTANPPKKMKVLGDQKNTMVANDTIRLTQYNPFSKKETELVGTFKTYFAEGIGVVRIHDTEMKTDFVLEKILKQDEWVKIMNR
jgi:hypothetical protein